MILWRLTLSICLILGKRCAKASVTTFTRIPILHQVKAQSNRKNTFLNTDSLFVITFQRLDDVGHFIQFGTLIYFGIRVGPQFLSYFLVFPSQGTRRCGHTRTQGQENSL